MRDGVQQRVFPGRCYPGQFTCQIGVQHDAVLEQGGLRHGSQYRAALDYTAGFDLRSEGPFLLMVKRCGLDTPSDEGSTAQFQHRQWTLDAVEDAL